jgi:hypothetical protein
VRAPLRANSLLLTQIFCRLLFAFHVSETHSGSGRCGEKASLPPYSCPRGSYCCLSLCVTRDENQIDTRKLLSLSGLHCALGHKEIAELEIRAQKGITAAASCNRHFELCEPFNCCWTNNFHCFRRSGASRRNHCAPFFEIFLRGSTHT